MAENSKIQWTDHTFNPWIGCTKVSPGCDNCYAEAREDKRLHRVKWGAGQPRHRTKTWGEPVKWNAAAAAAGRRDRVFCASLADVFDNEVDGFWRLDLFRLIVNTPHLDWLLLTKRIGNAAKMMQDVAEVIGAAMLDAGDKYRPLPNVWLGATVVNQEEADRDIPKLLATPARVRFLSMEPLLGDVNLRLTRLAPLWAGDGPAATCRSSDRRGLHWVIVGGESGPNARPFAVEWARSIVRQCSAAGVPAFVKQLGGHPEVRELRDSENAWYRLPLRDRKGGDIDEWPHDLRVREFPR